MKWFCPKVGTTGYFTEAVQPFAVHACRVTAINVERRLVEVTFYNRDGVKVEGEWIEWGDLIGKEKAMHLAEREAIEGREEDDAD